MITIVPPQCMKIILQLNKYFPFFLAGIFNPMVEPVCEVTRDEGEDEIS